MHDVEYDERLKLHPEPYLSSALFPASVTSGWEVSPR